MTRDVVPTAILAWLRRLLRALDWTRTVASRHDSRKCASGMSFTYVIPDIHGRRDLLGRALADIAGASGRRRRNHRHDRRLRRQGAGKQAGHRPAAAWRCRGWRFVALKGNHDAMMVQALRDGSIPRSWRRGWRRAATRRWRPTAAIRPPCRRPTSPGSIDLSADACRRASPLRSRRRRSRNSAGPAERSDAVVEALSEGIRRTASANATSFTAMTMIPTARCCTKAAPIWTRWPGERDG